MTTNADGPVPGALLIVDDEPAILELVSRVCETIGYSCFRAENGTDALSLFEQHCADIAAIMTDVNMPGMDGFALIRAVRSRSPQMKIILSSGSLGGADEQVAIDLGVNAFLPKPYTTGQLLECVGSLVGR
jgi:two-component system, cell cycle sensor histidine kinase and response regulator CckA